LVTATLPSARRSVPEHIHITDNAIIPLKERVVDRFYDPLKKLLRVVFPKS
jgi:succinate dehydrogenase / fumarate reductase iron-sulfur subunit